MKKKFELLCKYNGTLDVWNPAEKESEGDNHTWAEFMAQDIKDIETKCTGIYMFGRWFLSHGALVELLSAHRLNKTITIEQVWLRWVPKLLNITLGEIK